MPERTQLSFEELAIQLQEGEPWSLHIGCGESAGCTDTQALCGTSFDFERRGKNDSLIGKFAERDLRILREILDELSEKIDKKIGKEKKKKKAGKKKASKKKKAG